MTSVLIGLKHALEDPEQVGDAVIVQCEQMTLEDGGRRGFSGLEQDQFGGSRDGRNRQGAVHQLAVHTGTSHADVRCQRPRWRVNHNASLACPPTGKCLVRYLSHSVRGRRRGESGKIIWGQRPAVVPAAPVSEESVSQLEQTELLIRSSEPQQMSQRCRRTRLMNELVFEACVNPQVRLTHAVLEFVRADQGLVTARTGMGMRHRARRFRGR